VHIELLVNVKNKSDDDVGLFEGKLKLNGLLGFEEVEKAIRELTTLIELKKLKETQVKLKDALKELEEKKRQDEVIRRQLYEDAASSFFLQLLLKREAISDLTVIELEKAISDFHSKFWSIKEVRKLSRKYMFSEGEFEKLIKTLKPLREALIKCFREMIHYLESLEGWERTS